MDRRPWARWRIVGPWGPVYEGEDIRVGVDIAREEMDARGFWPNLWHIDERGSVALVDPATLTYA
jgi:hypothetical protein